MKAPGRIILVVILLAFLTPLLSAAQFYKDMRVGLDAGVYIYQGDLTPDRLGSLKTPSAGVNVFAQKPINSFLAARFNMSFASLRGDDSKYAKPDWRQQRNFRFSTPVKEFSAQLVWNIRGRNYDDRGIMPYLFSGAGVTFVNIKKDYSRMNAPYFSESPEIFTGLAADSAAGLPRRLLSIPVGIGAEYPVSARLLVNVEMAYRFIFTDYLDGFSKSANPNQQDHYHSTSIGLVYKFGKHDNGLGCPVMKY